MECSDVCSVHLRHNMCQFPYFSVDFCLTDLSSGESEVLKSPTTSVWGLICDLSFRSVSFTYESAFIFGA